jgi:hypothetical protein
MAEKRKAGGASKEALAVDKQKAQSERFIKAARELGVDESGKTLDRAIRAIVSKTDRSKTGRGES